MKRKWGLILAAAMLWQYGGTAFAGHDAGNGGYTVRCDHASPDGNHLETLDYHEIRVRFPPHTFTIDLGGQGDEWARIRYALKRLSRLDPERAAAYQDKADHFLANANMVPNANLPDPGDMGKAYLEAGCQAIPTVIQYHGQIPEQRLYTVNQDLFNALSSDHRAGLVLHEIVYGEALARGAQDSMGARYFTALISSAEIGSMSQADYQTRVAAAGLVASTQLAWISNPLLLPDAQEHVPYQQSLSPFVQGGNGQPLTFSLMSGPSWLQLSIDGVLSGIPTRQDVGALTAVVAVKSEGGDAGVTTSLVLKVLPGHDLAWSKNPIDLGTFEPGRAVMADLAPYAISDAAVTFSVTGAPAWLTLSSSGALAGTPRDSDIGSYAFEVTATNAAGLSATVKVECAVGAVTWNFSVVERHVMNVNLNQPQYVGADAGAGLHFGLLNAPSWATLTSDGTLMLSPGRADIGSYSFSVSVNKGDIGHIRQIAIEVVKEPQIPVWRQDPILFNMQVGTAFSADLSAEVACPDGSPVTFSLLSGPAWLTISAAGQLTGTPALGNVGDNSFIVSATCGDGSSAQDTVSISVTK